MTYNTCVFECQRKFKQANYFMFKYLPYKFFCGENQFIHGKVADAVGSSYKEPMNRDHLIGEKDTKAKRQRRLKKSCLYYFVT